MCSAIAQCFGSFGSHLYGHLIGTGQDPNKLYFGYLLGAGAMILGGVVAAFLAVGAEGKSLEDIATPLSVIGKPPGGDLPHRRAHDHLSLSAGDPHHMGWRTATSF